MKWHYYEGGTFSNPAEGSFASTQWHFPTAWFCRFSKSCGWFKKLRMTSNRYIYFYYFLFEMISCVKESTYDNLRRSKLRPRVLLNFRNVANVNLGRTSWKYPKSCGSQLRSHDFRHVLNYTSTSAAIFFRFSKTCG